jgi:hypothetical protein
MCEAWSQAASLPTSFAYFIDDAVEDAAEADALEYPIFPHIWSVYSRECYARFPGKSRTKHCVQETQA